MKAIVSALVLLLPLSFSFPKRRHPPILPADVNQFHIDPSQNPVPLGTDMLNVTKCYCMLEGSQHFERHAQAGHYYEWIYYNFHTNTWFNISRYCRTKETHRSHPPGQSLIHKINDCLSFWAEDQDTPSCDLDSRGNRFCIRLKWEDGDFFTYNKQTRSVDGDRHLAPAEEVEKKCDTLCGRSGTQEEIIEDGKMEMLKGVVLKELNHHINKKNDFLWSYINTVYDVDDMCPTCK